jgi:hypothetical protein
MIEKVALTDSTVLSMERAEGKGTGGPSIHINRKDG